MSLRSRLAISMVVFTALVVGLFGGVAYTAFVRTQSAELERRLDADLQRATRLLDQPTLGASFVDPGVPGVALDVVTREGDVVLSWGPDVRLPPVDGVERLRLEGRTYLATSGPWGERSGTVRVAHDIEAALAARTTLAAVLGVAGLAVFVLVAAGSIVLARRAVRPLADVASEARRVDPATPAPIAYVGRFREIHDLVDALNETLAAIARRSEDEHAFFREVAHELAAPMTLVTYHLDQLDADRVEPADLAAARRAAKELLRTSQDLLALARGDLDRPLDHSIVPLGDVVDRIARDYPGVRLDVDRSASVIGDPDRLAQVVRNLVRNGIRACGRDKGVEVIVRAGVDDHTIEVRDDGPGIDPDLADRIFEPGVGRGGELGIGLTICRRLVGQHGGTIGARAGREAGTVFEVQLPSLDAALGSSER